MYDADDERVWSFQPPANGLARFDRWTLRGLDGKVRRLVELYGDNWTNAWGGSNLWEDYIYRDGTLLAAYMSNLQQRHMDVDHLGTPRLLTNYGGIQSSYHVYLPYGVEATPFNQDQERMKFTGHERDLADPSSPADDLDYMHARFTNPTTGRFLSTDTALGTSSQPQSWNRYGYVSSNPTNLVDPLGLEGVLPDYGVGEGMIVFSGPGSYRWNAADSILFGRFQLSTLTGAVDAGISRLRTLYQDSFDRNAVAGGDNYAIAALDFMALELLLPKDSGDAGVALAMAAIPEVTLGKKAIELISGKLKRSASFRSELAEKTYAEILKLAKGKGPVAQAAKEMKKLIESGERLAEKTKIKPR